MAGARETNWFDGPVSRVLEDSGTEYSERVRARLEGYDPAGLQWRRVKVNASGELIASLDASTVNIGLVDQGAAGATAWKVDGSAVTQPVSLASLPAITFAAPQHVIVDSATLGTVAVSGSLGRSWTLGSGVDSVSVGNFPAGFTNVDDITDRAARLLGHVTVDNASIPAAQSGSWALSGSDGLATLAVSARLHNGYAHLYVRDSAAIGVLSEVVDELRKLRKGLHV